MHWRISKSLQRGVVNGNGSRQTGAINAYNSNRYGAPHPPALSSATVCFGLSAFARGSAGNTTTPTRRTPILGNHHLSLSNQIAGATIKRYASNKPTIYANLISNETRTQEPTPLPVRICSCFVWVCSTIVQALGRSKTFR
jgi:hypothetical protein